MHSTARTTTTVTLVLMVHRCSAKCIPNAPSSRIVLPSQSGLANSRTNRPRALHGNGPPDAARREVPHIVRDEPDRDACIGNNGGGRGGHVILACLVRSVLS